MLLTKHVTVCTTQTVTIITRRPLIVETQLASICYQRTVNTKWPLIVVNVATSRRHVGDIKSPRLVVEVSSDSLRLTFTNADNDI